MNKKLKLFAETCASFASKNRVPLWILASLATLALLFGLVQSGYKPGGSEGPIVITDSDGNVLNDELDVAPTTELSTHENY